MEKRGNRVIWLMILTAFAAWGVPAFHVSVHEEPLQVASAAAAPLRDGSCGIFIGPTFEIIDELTNTEGFQQAVISHEVAHCLGYDHPTEYRPTIMIPNVLGPTLGDLIAPFTHEPWHEPFQYRAFAPVAAD